MSGLRYWTPVATITVFADTDAAAEIDAVRAPRAVESRGRARDRELGSELLRLHERAAREHLPRDPRGKAEIVLDARARPRLPARRVRLDDEHVEPLRRRVDGGGEARGPGADDDDVAHDVLVHGVQTQAVRDLLDRRLLQDGAPRQMTTGMSSTPTPNPSSAFWTSAS